jgi:hypothetical protein
VGVICSNTWRHRAEFSILRLVCGLRRGLASFMWALENERQIIGNFIGTSAARSGGAAKHQSIAALANRQSPSMAAVVASNSHFAQIVRAAHEPERAGVAALWAFARVQAERDRRLCCKPVLGEGSSCLE